MSNENNGELLLNSDMIIEFIKYPEDGKLYGNTSIMHAPINDMINKLSNCENISEMIADSDVITACITGHYDIDGNTTRLDFFIRHPNYEVNVVDASTLKALVVTTSLGDLTISDINYLEEILLFIDNNGSRINTLFTKFINTSGRLSRDEYIELKKLVADLKVPEEDE